MWRTIYGNVTLSDKENQTDMFKIYVKIANSIELHKKTYGYTIQYDSHSL